MPFVILAAAAVQAASAPAALQPFGKWQVNYADQACLLSRSYGPVDAQVTLGFQPLPLSGTAEFIIATPGQRFAPGSGKATVTLIPSGATAKGNYIEWSPAGTKRRIARIEVTEIAL